MYENNIKMYHTDIRCRDVDYFHPTQEYTKYSSLMNVWIPQTSKNSFANSVAKVLKKSYHHRLLSSQFYFAVRILSFRSTLNNFTLEVI
jgi:hypothetical protein